MLKQKKGRDYTWLNDSENWSDSGCGQVRFCTKNRDWEATLQHLIKEIITLPVSLAW